MIHSELKELFGPKCSAINVNGEITEFINIPIKQMKFCEAVNQSFNIPLRLTNDNTGCPGARRCTGFVHNDNQLSENISSNNKIPIAFILEALRTIPSLNNVRHVNLGMTEEMQKEIKPDLFILYIKPGSATTIMHTLAKHHLMPSIPTYSFLSVCGNVFANCYINRSVSISFGCPESRKHGGIANGEVVLGISYEIAKKIVGSFIHGPNSVPDPPVRGI